MRSIIDLSHINDISVTLYELWLCYCPHYRGFTAVTAVFPLSPSPCSSIEYIRWHVSSYEKKSESNCMEGSGYTRFDSLRVVYWCCHALIWTRKLK